MSPLLWIVAGGVALYLWEKSRAPSAASDASLLSPYTLPPARALASHPLDPYSQGHTDGIAAGAAAPPASSPPSKVPIPASIAVSDDALYVSGFDDGFVIGQASKGSAPALPAAITPITSVTTGTDTSAPDTSRTPPHALGAYDQGFADGTAAGKAAPPDSVTTGPSTTPDGMAATAIPNYVRGYIDGFNAAQSPHATPIVDSRYAPPPPSLPASWIVSTGSLDKRL